ncbi:Frag1/DRAM/Sfk1 family-domain-containing protein [Phakopsora pachyrhizi]|uniref:Frag1/DRAM/Sfk1 family-domain-containing protein n=1 Tax=Phakopsora pachyrhizi TaxID=170000 RepID=A0AAV0BMG5_PHAPC|nr:Frag1/DRAM/Sfk1 family-domain-containing protein [Phakopsora pachyrhizi]
MGGTKNLRQANASWVSYIHTGFALAAFGSAMVLGISLHYQKIVKNEWYGYPQEWFPSVSATIGDYYPERPIFQILIALTSGPRVFLVFMSYVFQTHFSPRSSFSSLLVAICGLLRTISCGGWVYITSSDNHDVHDFMMISYLLLTIPWQLGNILLTPSTVQLAGNKCRKRFSRLFFISIFPLVYFYIQHKVKRVPGVYDVLYDACTVCDFSNFEFQVIAILMTQFIIIISIVLFFCLNGTCLFGFIFWTTLTALGPTIFYFSVWSMGLDGQEVLLFATLSPFLICLPLFRQLILRTLPLLRFLTLLSIGSYMVDRGLFYDDPVLRLQLTAASLAICTILHVVQMFDSTNYKDLKRQIVAFELGLILSVAIKYANYSLNPMWPIMRLNNGGWNRLGLIIGIWASFRLRRTQELKSKVSSIDSDSSTLYDLKVSWWRAVLGFGGAIFATHTLFTDSGTVIAWVWDGYPITGPIAAKHGYMIIIAMCIGLFLSNSNSNVVRGPQWFSMGAVSAFGLMNYHGWLGFSSGCVFCIFILSLLPRFIEDLIKSSKPYGWSAVGLGFGLSYLIYDVMELVHTFTVAYAFVPGGNIFRERTGTVLVVTILLIGLGLLQPNSASQTYKWKESRKLIELRVMCNFLMASIIYFSIYVMYIRTAPKEVKPYHPEYNSFKAGIWTVHFGVDSGMWESQRRMRDIIRELELDVVGLLETDLQRIVMGNRDITQFIAEDLGMYVDLGPGPNKHTWGAALLSKFPIINSTHHLLPSPHGELAPAIHATLDIWGTPVDFIVSHNGQEEDPLDRELQSIKLAQIMREAYPKPFVFLGYVVTKPHAPRPSPYRILIEDGKMLDIERSDYDRWCEYILFRGMRRTGYARVTRGSTPAVTDTELQVGMFQLPPSWIKVDPDKDPAEYTRIPPKLVDPSIQFSAKVGSPNGFKGHKYHVLREQFGVDVLYYGL